MAGRSLDEILGDLADAGTAAAELVARGKQAWDTDRLLRLAGEAVVGRVADAANRLPDEVKAAIPDVPWDDIRDIRIVVDHIYHRVDYALLWETLRRDIPNMIDCVRVWQRDRQAR